MKFIAALCVALCAFAGAASAQSFPGELPPGGILCNPSSATGAAPAQPCTPLQVGLTSGLGAFGGRITPSSGVCAPVSDAAAATTIYYAPCGLGETVPIYNGSNVQAYQFTSGPTDTVGLSLALGSNWSANTIYDVFVGLNSGTVTLGTGPAWSNSGAGTSTRGTGSGTTQLALYDGIWTNAVSITLRYSNSATFTCPANQCTYLGSFVTNGTAGEVDLKFGTSAAGGGTACLCIWNLYNQIQARVRVADSNGTNTTGSSWRPYLNDSGNAINFLNGMQLNGFIATISGAFSLPNAVGSTGRIGTALNSSTPSTPDCQTNSITDQTTTSLGVAPTIAGSCPYAAQFGYNTLYLLEGSAGTAPTTVGGSGLGPYFQFLTATMWW